MIRAIVLAAGASSRMGTAKAGLPLGQTGETVLGRVVKTLLEGGIPDVTVVAGAHVEAVRRAMPAFLHAVAGRPAARRAHVIDHAGWAQGQLSSLRAGLDAIDGPLLEGAMVTLVDVPLVRPSTVAALISEWRRTSAAILRPADGARHGHPVIFNRSVFEDLRAADLAAGAKSVFARHHVLNVAVKDPGAFIDLDTPGDYEKVLRSRGFEVWKPVEASKGQAEHTG